MIGPGKYDDWVTEIIEKEHAAGCILIVINGDRGQGFSCQLPRSMAGQVPAALRHMADQIEKDTAD